MAEPTDGSLQNGLRQKRELLSMDQPCPGSSTAHGQATPSQLARPTGSHPSTKPSLGSRDLPTFGIKVLLDHRGERICNRSDVQESQAIEPHLSDAGASRNHQLLQCRRDAFSGTLGGFPWKSPWQL